MRKYVIMGVQGSGKGTQSQLLAADLDLVHIGVGDMPSMAASSNIISASPKTVAR